MSVQTFEGIVSKGQIALESGLTLPEKTKVYIVVPNGLEKSQPIHIRTPRLKHPEQISEFKIEMIEDSLDG